MEYPVVDDSLGEEFVDFADLEIEASQEDAPQPTVLIYSDSYVEVGGSVFRLDDVTKNIVKVLGKGEILTRDELLEACFGGYRNFDSASDAQKARLDRCIGILAEIETASGVELFTVFEVEGSEEVLFEGNFEKKSARKPFEIAEIEEDEIEVEEEDHPDTLSEMQSEMVRTFSNLKLYAKDHEDRIMKRVVFQALLGTPNPDLDQQVLVNKALADLNEWLARNNMGLEIKPVVTSNGPAFEVTNIFAAEVLAEEVELKTAELLQKFEDTKEQREANKAARALEKTVKALKGSKKRVREPSVGSTKPVVKKEKSSLARKFSFSKDLGPKDIEAARRMSQLLGVDERAILTTRFTIGRVIAGGKVATGKEQIEVIKFLQAGWGVVGNNEPIDRNASRELAKWLDAGLGLMIATYEKRISGMAQAMSGGSQSIARSLEKAGVFGLHDGIKRFKEGEPGSLYPSSYIGLRIHGEMVALVRLDTGLAKGQVDKYKILSVDLPLPGDLKRAKVTTKDADPTIADYMSTHDSRDEVSDQEITLDISSQLLAAIDDVRVGPDFNSSRHDASRNVKAVLWYMGYIDAMNGPEIRAFAKLVGHSGDNPQYPAIAEMLGVTQSRVSQLVREGYEDIAKALAKRGITDFDGFDPNKLTVDTE